MKVTVGRRFQVKGEGYESRNIDVEVTHEDLGIVQEDVVKDFNGVRNKLVLYAERVLLLYLISYERLDSESAKDALTRVAATFGIKSKPEKED
jgi:hypothetical protein